jgi:hypothetical protein
MGVIRIDDSRFPLVLVTFQGPATDDEFDAYLGGMSRILEGRKRNVTILDARLAASPPAKQRAKQADWLKTNRVLLQQYSCGSVFIIKSTMIRGALTAILWIAPMSVPHAVVSTLEEAERWALGRLREEGVSLPSSGASVRPRSSA